jgi:hypothetical protein
VGYSLTSLPQLLTAPRYVISNEDRDEIVLRGTLSSSSKDSKKKKDKKDKKGKKHDKDKSISAPIFCGKGARALPDGTYIFRIGGALSKTNPHRDTQWEFCGRRGTSDEELKFTMDNGKCNVVAKHSRWDLPHSLSLVDFSGSFSMHFTSMAMATVDSFNNVALREEALDELESALFARASTLIPSLDSISLTSVVIKDGVLNANVRIRLSTGFNESNQEQLSAELQSQLASEESVTAILQELLTYPEFTSVSKVVMSDVHYESSFQSHSEGLEFTTSDEYHTSITDHPLFLFFVLLAFVVLSASLLIFAIMRR